VTHIRLLNRVSASVAIAAVFGLGTLPSAAASEHGSTGQTASEKKKQLDRSGHKRVGKASFYHRKFTGRKMANGKPMNPHDDNAASKTLPLGTTAKVTNLETGRSTVVTIEDRGPYVPGRIVDLSPSSAEQIGLTREEGVARVAVAPISVPMPDGSVKPGAGAGAP
jgi:rare lipoprotein A